MTLRPVAKYNEVAKPPWQRSRCYWQMWPPSPRGRRLHTYVRRCACFAIQMSLGTSLGESRKVNWCDVETQFPTNQKWNVAPYRREEGRGSCVGRHRPVVSGPGCVLISAEELPPNQNQPINIFPCTGLNPLSCLSASKYWTRFMELLKPSCSSSSLTLLYHFEMYIQSVWRRRSC